MLLFLFTLLGALSCLAVDPSGMDMPEDTCDEVADETCALQVGQLKQQQIQALHSSSSSHKARVADGEDWGKPLSKALPLGVGHWDGYQIGPYVLAAFPGLTDYKRLTLDTGSSTLAFCHDSGASKQHGETEFCAAYGNLAWWGYAYTTDIEVLADKDGFFTILNATYAIMEADVGFCEQGLDGIFGIAFAGLNYDGHFKSGFPLPTAETPYNEYCTNTNWESTGDPTPPLLHQLENEGGVPAQIGIYWTGELGDHQATLYLDEKTRSNFHYNPNPAAPLKAVFANTNYYDINIVNIVVGNSTFPVEGTPFDCTKDLDVGPCILDTGTPGWYLPTDSYNAYQAASPDTEVSIELQGFNGGPNPVLKFTKAILDGLRPWGQNSASAVMEAPPGDVILGWVTWSAYYIVMDISENSVEFVPNPVCEPDAHVTCPNSATMCSGQQCCPGNSETSKTFPCPSAPPGTIDCESDSKLLNCLVPYIPYPP